MFSKLHRDIIINKRVQAAVQAAQTQSNDIETIDIILKPSAQQRVMNNQHDVTGSEADQEHHQHSNHEDYSLPLLLIAAGID